MHARVLSGGGVLVSLTDQMANSTGNYTLGTGLIVRDCHAGEAGAESDATIDWLLN